MGKIVIECSPAPAGVANLKNCISINKIIKRLSQICWTNKHNQLAHSSAIGLKPDVYGPPFPFES